MKVERSTLGCRHSAKFRNFMQGLFINGRTADFMIAGQSGGRNNIIERAPSALQSSICVFLMLQTKCVPPARLSFGFTFGCWQDPLDCRRGFLQSYDSKRPRSGFCPGDTTCFSLSYSVMVSDTVPRQQFSAIMSIVVIMCEATFLLVSAIKVAGVEELMDRK